MKLTDKQQDILYIVISVIVGILLGISVYFIIKHIRNKKCDDNNPCPSGKICQNKKCVDDRSNCSCDGKKCGEDDGCGTKCDGPCPSGQTCQNKNCVDDRPPKPVKTCTDDKLDPYETGNCKPCCDGIQMYKIKERNSQPRFICSSIKPDNLTPNNPYKNKCPPEPEKLPPVPPASNRTKINYTWNDGFDTLDGDKNMSVNDDWDFFDYTGEKVFRFGIDTATIKSGAVNCGAITNQIRIDKLPDKKYLISGEHKKVNFVLLSPEKTKGEIYGFANCVGGPVGLVAEYIIDKEPGGSGGGSDGWEDAKKCSEIGVIKAGACGNQRYVCAPNKNDIPGCRNVPFRCDKIKCLNE